MCELYHNQGIKKKTYDPMYGINPLYQQCILVPIFLGGTHGEHYYFASYDVFVALRIIEGESDPLAPVGNITGTRLN